MDELNLTLLSPNRMSWTQVISVCGNNSRYILNSESLMQYYATTYHFASDVFTVWFLVMNNRVPNWSTLFTLVKIFSVV